jgi:iron-sulfur cluster assembly protein
MTDGSDLRVSEQQFALTLTDAAARRVREIVGLLEFAPQMAGLRVHVVEGGCSGLNYDVQVVAGPETDDTVHVINDTRVFVNPFSLPHVNGTAVDWISSFQESRFVFQNPNATGGCGCGISFTTD